MSAPRAIFILSTGRCSTQYLAQLLALGTPKAVVVHEGAGSNYVPTQVFRQNSHAAVVEKIPPLRRHFGEIDAVLAGGKSFIDTGWPSYAWGPYLSQRFGTAFRFAHLLRNPFASAASLSTHMLLDDLEAKLSKFGVMRPQHPQARFAEFGAQYPDFSRYERGLYHWLEVNTYLLEQHTKPGFLGLYRYEDMYSGKAPAAKRLWHACGFLPESYQELPPYDRLNAPALRFAPPNPTLVGHVWALAKRLGYAEALLQKWSNIDFLSARYQNTRVARP